MDMFIFWISNAFLAYVIFRFAYHVFLNYTSIKLALVMVTIYYLTYSFCALYFNNPRINLFASLIGIALITLPSTDRIFKKIFFVIFITCLEAVCDILVFTFINKPGYLVSTGIIINLLMFVIEIIIETFFSRRYESDIKKIQWYVLCIIPIVTLIMLLITDSYRAIAPKLGPICAGSSLIINIIFFQFYDTLCDYYDKLMNMQQAESQLKLYESQLQYMKATEKKMNAFRHDINNNLSVIRQMAETNRTEELLTFLEQFHASLPKDSLTLYTQHTDFNLLLNYLVEKAKVQNIHPEIHTAIPITLDYNIYDMNILLSNLFDNAIEAAALTDDKILKLQIKYNKGILNIEICNSYDGEILRQGNQYATTKSNKNLHGYGLKNIEKVVEKYEGTLNISHTGNLFTVSIYMFI